MITPARINNISNEIADVYAHIADELLVNIGRHITSPTWTHTASWEIQKLAELGQLTAENAAIINKWIKAIPPELRNAMEETRKAALSEIEKQMDAAAKNGYVTPPVTDSSVAVFQDMQAQAADRLNLVNTTMLQSSVDQYQRAVVLTQQEYDKLMAQREATQRALNEGAGSVASGVETRRAAVRRAIGRISAEGLTGFIDRAGRHWTPEAYVNMDVRTTVHNTAIQATRARMSDFGTQVFQVSSHAGARPLCYPYQGKFYSWDNTAGTIELGDSSVVSYEPINSTSYGQPAGLFGINCGHYPIPIIAGVTIPHGADNIQPEEENDKAYAESQEQRALERKIREAKRLVEMAGDSATPEDKQKVKDAQAQMREFIAKTGRTRRYDREQIGGTPQTARTPSKPENVNGALTTPKIREVKVEDSDISRLADATGVEYRPVTYHETQPTQEEIIEALAGGDLTNGSCASVGLAYCGQTNGLNVLDFRDGESRKLFSRDSTLEQLKKIDGIEWVEQGGNYYGTTGNQLLKKLEIGKEYWFACGRHAAIVRRTEPKKWQYLELQSALRSGWQDFNGNPRYTLANRFGAPSSKYWDATSFAFAVESVKDSPEFAKILGYINTAEGDQKKGARGSIK